MDDPFEIAGTTLASRLILGTGGAPSMDALESAIRASGTGMVTVSLRRVTAGVPGSVLDICSSATEPGSASYRTRLGAEPRERRSRQPKQRERRSTPTGSKSK